MSRSISHCATRAGMGTPRPVFAGSGGECHRGLFRAPGASSGNHRSHDLQTPRLVFPQTLTLGSLCGAVSALRNSRTAPIERHSKNHVPQAAPHSCRRKEWVQRLQEPFRDDHDRNLFGVNAVGPDKKVVVELHVSTGSRSGESMWLDQALPGDWYPHLVENRGRSDRSWPRAGDRTCSAGDS